MYSYELKDLDEQAERYDFVLTIYGPNGPERHAVDAVSSSEEGDMIHGGINRDEETIEIVVAFPSTVFYTLIDRRRFDRLSQAERVERTRSANLLAATNERILKEIWEQHGPQPKREY